MNELGWDVEELLARMRTNSVFWKCVKETALAQFLQHQHIEVQRFDWYVPAPQRPAYLSFEGFKTVARFRCGVEGRANDKWRHEVSCRVCGFEKETMDHIAECMGVRLEDLMDHRGGKGKEMRGYLARRVEV